MEALLAQIQALRTKRDRMTELFNEQIEMLGFKLQERMENDGLDKFKSEVALAYFTTPKTAEVSDWVSFSDYIIKNNALDLLEKRVSVGALEKRIEAGENVKGVTILTGEKKLIIRKN
jgi:hypothetical protein